MMMEKSRGKSTANRVVVRIKQLFYVKGTVSGI